MADYGRDKRRTHQKRIKKDGTRGCDMDRPLVSVIIPTYNCAGTIKQAIDSAKAQNVNAEIIIIDDCSADATEDVMQAYQEDPVIFYARNPKNLGAAQSRNKGVAMARGEYIAFLDADDFWAAGKLEKQLAAIRRTGCVLCSTARELAKPDGTLTGRIIPVKETITYRQLLRHNCINCSSVLVRSDVMRAFPMEHEDAHEDYICWLRILKKYGCACAVNEPLLKYRLTYCGKSGDKRKSARMTLRVYRYMGFGTLQSLFCFCSYTLHGLAKYGQARLRGALRCRSGPQD